MFCCEFCEISKNTFFYSTPEAASPSITFWMKIEKKDRVEKVNLFIYREFGDRSMKIKLTDGFIYPINVSFGIIPDMIFSGGRYTTLTLVLAKVIWCLQYSEKEGCVRSIDKRALLICWSH